MAHKLISGYSGNHLVLNYAQTALVSMESPNPHAPGTNELNRAAVLCTLTTSTSEYKITTTATGSANFEAYFDVFMVYDGNGTLNFTLSKSANVTDMTSSIWVRVDGSNIGGSLDLSYPTGGTVTGTKTVPYYRYRVRVLLAGQGTALTTSDWVKLSVSLS